MATRGSNRQGWPRAVLAIIVTSLTLITPLTVMDSASAAPPTRPTTTTTTSTTTTSTTTTTTTSPTSGGTTTGGTTTSGATPKLTAVAALSRHRVLATYDRDLDAAALQMSSYAFYSTQAVNLPVTGVSRATNNQAYVMTGAQEAVTYEVKKPRTARPITFTGSLATEPKLVSARSLSKTQLLVSFSEPVGSSALQPSAYRITVQGSTATLNVTGAAMFGTTQKEVLLTTDPQEAKPYVLAVADIQAASGTYMDPTANTLQFSGSTVLPGPMLLRVRPDGDTRLILTFDVPLSPTANEVARYTSTPRLFISSATLQGDAKEVVLQTDPQYQVQYTLVANVTGADGNPVNPAFNSGSFTGTRPVSNERPKVVSAVSTGNKSVMVQFSKPMADSTDDPARFVIVQTVVHPEVGTVGITKAEFVPGTDRTSVLLTTLSQAEVTYQVTANNVTDIMGNPLADKTNVSGVLVDPTSFVFPGTPPSYIPCPAGAPATCVPVDERVDSDSDGLWDHEETRGWEVTIKLANGGTQTRQITSSPFSPDTDKDGLKDQEERALNIDPRDGDTDDDALADWVEFNEYYSDPVNQDSDTDGLFDGLETATFFTSPIFDDTDGDQLKDGYEINVNRNAKVADLPQPMLSIGDMRMGLDVKFTESNGETTRELDSKTVEATLTQSQSQRYSRSESATHTVATKAAFSAGVEWGWRASFLNSESKKTLSISASTESSNTNSWSSNFTSSSSQASEQAYTNSLSTEQEVAKDSNITRDVYGARVQVGVFLEGRGNMAFTVRNLQVAALIQDPGDPSVLKPLTTLVPDTGIDTTFNLGPLVPPKGPIVFTSTDVSPELVEELMKDPSGVVFRFSNYDIVDEAGRNYAFISQDINDRTARIAIDFGGFDSDGDGRGDETEILRVATGVIGRRAVDTNGDGKVDDNDRKVVFDLQGKQVGLTLRDALEAAGLKYLDETTNPSTSLTQAERRKSFSTLKTTDGTGEVLFRVRDRAIQLDSPREWVIITPFGIDPLLRLDQRILYPGSNVQISFVQDEDKDRLPALTEDMNGCLDSPVKGGDGRFVDRDTDRDGLDDRFEVLTGWNVDTRLNSGRVHSQCHSADSDGDGLTDLQEAPGILRYDPAGLVLFGDGVSAPRSVADLVTTATSAVVRSNTADFTTVDVGAPISAPGIPDNTRILSVDSSTQATMTAKATATAPTAGVAATIGALFVDENAPKRDVAGSAPRSVTDLKTTSASSVVTSATANFTTEDVGKAFSGPGIPGNTAIATVQSATQATLTARATATATPVTATIGGFAGRSVTDLGTTAGSPKVTSAGARFTTRDVGVTISAPGIPDDATILSVESPTQATMTANAGATASGVPASIGLGIGDQAIYDPTTDPLSPDTDVDGMNDLVELTLYKNDLPKPFRKTSPEHPDTDFDQLTDGVEKKLGSDPRSDDRAAFWDSDRDGLTDAEEVGDDNRDFEIDESERAGAGWDVAVTEMHQRLTTASDPYSAVATVDDTVEGTVHLVDRGQNLRVGMIVDIRDEASGAAPLNTSVDAIEPALGDDARVTFGTAFTGVKGLNVYRTVCKNGTCPAQHVTVSTRVYSSKYDADTDDDGLTDFEESRLKTDPGCRVRESKQSPGTFVLDCKPGQTEQDGDEDGVRDGWDTDGDGLTDFQEVRGFKLRDGTTVKTKPAHVDTDNDRRSDGDEAGLPGGELIVRLPGSVVYEALSNPTRPDTDFDLLVDGDEQVFGIDPTIVNTDKDNKSDYSEVLEGRRPEVPDMKVTMHFQRLAVDKDGEKENDAGDFKFRFYAVMKDGSDRLVVHSDKVNTEGVPRLPLDQLPGSLPLDATGSNCPAGNWLDQCWVTTNNGTQTIVRIHDFSSVPFSLDEVVGRPVHIGSISTTDAVPEQFGVRGYVMEFDDTNNDVLQCKVDIFPDVFGNVADGTGIVKGSQLRLGVNSMAVHRSGVKCNDGDLDFTLGVSYKAE